MKDLYIVGAGGMGRELLNYVLDVHKYKGPKWNIKGFLDDTENPLSGKECDYGVAGTIVDYQPKPDDVLLMGISNPADKRKLALMLKARGAVFDTMVHPWANLGNHNEIGEGNVFYAAFGMTVNCKIGNFCTLLTACLGHDVQIGDYVTVSSHTNIMGRVKIGKGAFIGGNVGIGPGVAIGEGAYVCLGSMVLEDVPAGAKVLGNPARIIGQVDGKW